MLVMFFFPVILLAVYSWFPGSPYYLLQKGKPEQAKAALLRLYGNGNHVMVDIECSRLESDILASKHIALLEKEATVFDLFRGSNLKHTATAFLAVASQQVSGVIFVIGYLTSFCPLAGIPSGFNRTMYLFTISPVANTTAYWTIERFGKRFLCVYGLLIMETIDVIIGGLNVAPTATKLTATVALILVWAALYQLTIAST